MLILLKHGGKQSKTKQWNQEKPKDISLQVQPEWKWQIHFPCKYSWKTVEFLKLLWTLAKHNWISKFKDEREITLKLKILPLCQCSWMPSVQKSALDSTNSNKLRFFPTRWHFCFKNCMISILQVFIIVAVTDKMTQIPSKLGEHIPRLGVASTKHNKKKNFYKNIW